jgi:hypothetical protein
LAAITILVKLLNKLGAYSTTLSESASPIIGIGVALVAIASSESIFRLMQFVVINCAYGHATWVSGLRVSDWKHGVLSNGDFLAGWSYVALYLGGFVLWGMCSLTALFLFSYIGLRLRGGRLNDPKPKKKWRSSGKSDSAG